MSAPNVLCRSAGIYNVYVGQCLTVSYVTNVYNNTPRQHTPTLRRVQIVNATLVTVIGDYPPSTSGYDAWRQSVRLQVRVSATSPMAGRPGRYIIVRRCEELSMVLLQLKDPLELFVKRR